jgi:hypothetical protein
MEIKLSDVIEAVSAFASPSLLELVAIGEQMTTPDGRWLAFQDWLKKNPRWRKSVNNWMKLEAADAFVKLKEAIIADSENPAMFRFLIKKFVNAEMEARIIRSIETLQKLYKERKKPNTKTKARIDQ